MSYQEFLSFERRGAVGIVRLARPEKLNTISAPFYEAMIELQQTEIVGDHDLRAIALLADGRHFSAGIDLKEKALSAVESAKEDIADAVAEAQVKSQEKKARAEEAEAAKVEDKTAEAA